MAVVKIRTSYYQQHSADPAATVPAESFGGWQQADLDFDLDRTALVVMHAWDSSGDERFPGWSRCVEYRPRARLITETVFPPLLGAARRNGLRCYHVVGGNDSYYRHLPEYAETLALAGAGPDYPQVQSDSILERLEVFRRHEIFPGRENLDDVERGWKTLDFAPEARPGPGEAIAENGHQLAALCHRDNVNHLVYVGFAINWCLLMSPGGMVDMNRYGLLCSTIPEAVTAVENADTAREEREKSQALWRTSLNFGFVFDLENFLDALEENLPDPKI